MGFTDLTTSSGLATLEWWLSTRSYIAGYSPSQADAACFKALRTGPEATRYPNLARWYDHIASYQNEFDSLPGDPSKPYTAYGPETIQTTLNLKGSR